MVACVGTEKPPAVRREAPTRLERVFLDPVLRQVGGGPDRRQIIDVEGIRVTRISCRVLEKTRELKGVERAVFADVLPDRCSDVSARARVNVAFARNSGKPRQTARRSGA